MAQDPAATTARSNTALINLEMIGNNTSMSPEARMHAILVEVATWDLATRDSVGRYAACREADARRVNGTLYGALR